MPMLCPLPVSACADQYSDAKDVSWKVLRSASPDAMTRVYTAVAPKFVLTPHAYVPPTCACVS